MITLRSPLLNEKEAWMPLWQGYLTFYQAELSDEVTELTWQRFQDEQEPIYCIAAYEGDVMIGFVTYLLHRGTWAADYYCYLEDLFVDSTQRGKGVARQLISAVAEAAKKRRCDRLYWYTQLNNHTAQALYDKVARKTDFIQYRMSLKEG